MLSTPLLQKYERMALSLVKAFSLALVNIYLFRENLYKPKGKIHTVDIKIEEKWQGVLNLIVFKYCPHFSKMKWVCQYLFEKS